VSDVILPVAGIGVLVLDEETYRGALTRGAAFTAPQPTIDAEPLVDAETLAAHLSVPVTQVERLARENVIPSCEVGRWRRFSRSAVEKALAANARRA
jgi:excisionase family DNA binding protein